MAIPAHELALHAARKMLDKGAEELSILDVSDCGQLFDYAVIATGRSDRQTNTLVNEVYHFCKRHKVSHKPVEGDVSWFLIDCHDVIVHAFTEGTREFYDLDNLWKDAKIVDHERALTSLADIDKELREKEA